MRISKAFSQPEWASHSEVLKLVAVTEQDGQFKSNTSYSHEATLAQFSRASRIASNYAEFRITGVCYRFKPRFDTFAATTDNANTLKIPQLYYMVDKSGSIPNNPEPTLASLLQMGARAHRFDDKNVVVKYKPCVVVGMYNPVTAPVPVYTMRRTSPWLTTNSRAEESWFPNNTPHLGLHWILDAGTLPGDGAYEYDIELEINFQFRRPLAIVQQ